MSSSNDAGYLAILEQIQQRVLWIATNMIDVANHHRSTGDGIKVGGHQASCASMVTLMTALYMDHLAANDFVAVKPHGSPVLHAINYLLGDLDESQLSKLRQYQGLQAYPSRTKDPDRVDFSTGSVGLGPAATIFAANTRQYVDAHFGKRPDSRFVAVLGDAELDEGNIWEAVHDPETHRLAKVTWLIDFNRQSLDRIVPDMRISPWHSAFEAHGWRVIEVKYGRLLEAAFERPGGDLLCEWIDKMPNEQYQSLFAMPPEQVRSRFCEGAPAQLVAFLSDLTDLEVARLVTDLGGHDMFSVLNALRLADEYHDKPTVIFAYTHKGWGLPTQGSPRNHAAILSEDHVNQLREYCQIPADDPWQKFDPDSIVGRFLAQRAAQLRPKSKKDLVVGPTAEQFFAGKPTTSPADQPKLLASQPTEIKLPTSTKIKIGEQMATQEVFGKILIELSRDEKVAPYLVTTAPDVATSTNLAGWINRRGVFTASNRREWVLDPLLSWHESPSGQHIELGISEMNFFLLLGQLGLARTFSGQRLLPIGTVYDPFVCRGLDAMLYANYLGASYILVGTPSGITLAPEGGAHQSSITASIGIETPGITLYEPAYAQALDWQLCAALQKVADSDDVHPNSAYFRLSTKAVEQQPWLAAKQRIGEEKLREQVLAGAYLLIDNPDAQLTIAASGVVMPQAIAAVAALADEGIQANLVDVTSPGKLYQDWRAEILAGIHHARRPVLPQALASCFDAKLPLVTVHDASPHALAWLGGAVGTRTASLGVDSFGQSGAVHRLYEAYDIASESIVNAALGLVC